MPATIEARDASQKIAQLELLSKQELAVRLGRMVAFDGCNAGEVTARAGTPRNHLVCRTPKLGSF